MADDRDGGAIARQAAADIQRAYRPAADHTAMRAGASRAAQSSMNRGANVSDTVGNPGKADYQRQKAASYGRAADRLSAQSAGEAREVAADRVRNTRSMPGRFPVGGLSSEQKAPPETVAKLPPED